MSSFACTVERVRIEPHPNADQIEVARVGDFRSIVRKGQVRDGDLAVYIPEQAVVPSKDANEGYYKGRVTLSSKGLGAKGFALDYTNESNLYVAAAKKHGLLDAMLNAFGDLASVFGKPVVLYGEVFGRTSGGAGVQDLTYTGETLDFRAFDLSLGVRETAEFTDWDDLERWCRDLGVWTVPALYVGPYSREKVAELTDGETTLPCVTAVGATLIHIREGVVVKSATEAYHPRHGRKIAKSVSEAYLLRKGLVTEFQ